MAARHGGGDLRPRRVEHGDERRASVSSRSASSRLGDRQPPGQPPASDGEHAQALRRGRASARAAALGAARTAVGIHRASQRRQHLLGRALGVNHSCRPVAIHCGHEPQRRVERELARAPLGASPVGVSGAPSAAAAASSATSVGSPRQPPSPSSSAVLQAATRRSRASARPAAGRSAGRRPAGSPSGVQSAAARIRFSVSVPVLSVQMTVVEPSVSTALSRLTTAPRARQRAHTDGERERDRRQQPLRDVGDEQADREPERVGERQARHEHPDREERAGRRPTATAAISHATRRTCRSSGLSSRPTRCDSAAMRPSSVRMPVANTSAARLAAEAAGAAEHAGRARSSRSVARAVSPRRAVTGTDSPRQRGQVDLDRALEQAGVGRDAVALLDQITSPGTSSARLDGASPSVTQDDRLLRQVAAPAPRPLARPAAPARRRRRR